MFVTCNVIEMNYFIFNIVWMNLTSEDVSHLELKCRFYLRDSLLSRGRKQ